MIFNIKITRFDLSKVPTCLKQAWQDKKETTSLEECQQDCVRSRRFKVFVVLAFLALIPSLFSVLLPVPVFSHRWWAANIIVAIAIEGFLFWFFYLSPTPSEKMMTEFLRDYDELQKFLVFEWGFYVGQQDLEQLPDDEQLIRSFIRTRFEGLEGRRERMKSPAGRLQTSSTENEQMKKQIDKAYKAFYPFGLVQYDEPVYGLDDRLYFAC